MKSEFAYYRFTVKYMDYEDLEDPLSIKEMIESGLVVALNYSDATYKVCDYYGDLNVVSITLSGEIDCDVATDEELLDILQFSKE